MQFFRKMYPTSQQFSTEIIEDLCSLGFNSAIDNSDFPKEPYGEAWLKWKNEALLTTDQYKTLRFLKPLGYTIRACNSGVDAPEQYGFWGNLSGFFFIPLMNNSFFMRGYQENNSTVTIPYFHNILELLQTLAVTPSPEHPVTSLWTYMGLQTTNLSNYSPYLYFIYNGNLGGRTAFQCIIDRDSSFLPDGFDHYWLQSPDNTGGVYYYSPLTSVSVSASTCVLTKVPYQNAYIDGLYYIVVSPQESVDGKFFSFGGRNFLGAGRNLVVELPSN